MEAGVVILAVLALGMLLVAMRSGRMEEPPREVGLAVEPEREAHPWP